MPPIACLPNEPRLTDPVHQAQLTEQFLQPYANQIEHLFLSLRSRLDVSLRKSLPIKLNKPYPLGQCLEISKAFWDALKQVDVKSLSNDDTLGYQALVRFINAGGELKQVWGDLRGQYFQNAFVLGSWYLDVANDTVDANKKPVEILPFSESGLVPIKDFFHFEKVAQSYWNAVVLPNFLIPKLAPYFPIIVLQPHAGPQLQGIFDYMIALTTREGFQPSEAVLEKMNFPEAWFQALRQYSDFGQQLPTTMEECKQLSINACYQARENNLQADNSARNLFVKEALQVNQHWQGIRIQYS